MAHGNWQFATICELTIIGAAFGQTIVNTHHFQAGGTLEASLTSDQLAQNAGATLAAQWITALKASYLSLIAGDYNMNTVRAQILERPNQRNRKLTATDDPETGQGNAGGVNQTGEDAQVAGVIRWRTSLAGKKYRGRNYIGPLADAWRSNGLLTSGAITAFTAYKDLMLTNYAGGTPGGTSDWNLTVYSKPYDQGDYGYVRGSGSNREFYFPEDYDGAATDVLTGAVDSVLRTQRRRQIGVGA